VFNIQVGTAITLAIADGSQAEGELADVSYNDSWAHAKLSRRAKLEWLLGGEEQGRLAGHVSVDRGPLDDLRPTPFLNGELTSLSECFAFYRSGVQTKRDPFVYAVERPTLEARILEFSRGQAAANQPSFSGTDARPENIARAQAVDNERVVLTAYRPFDRRYLYAHPSFIDRPRPDLQGVWGVQNVGLYAMPSGTGAGPAVWCHGLLPDYHAFRGSYGGYAFPLWDRRPGHGPYNLQAELVSGLGAAYGAPVAPEAVFDAILSLLSATSYTTRFAEDLEDVFPHIPFPADRTVFDAAVRIGAEIRAVETFARPPNNSYLRVLARANSAPNGPLGTVEWAEGDISLCADGSGRINNIPEAVWEFAVSGYRVLPRWLASREGLAIGPTFIPELRDLVARIAELIDLFASADTILQSTVDNPLTRVALGLDSVVTS
jgi:predicted helicase